MHDSPGSVDPCCVAQHRANAFVCPRGVLILGYNREPGYSDYVHADSTSVILYMARFDSVRGLTRVFSPGCRGGGGWVTLRVLFITRQDFSGIPRLQTRQTSVTDYL